MSRDCSHIYVCNIRNVGSGVFVCGLLQWRHHVERMLHKDYFTARDQVKKISGPEPQGAWRQDTLTGGNPSHKVGLALTINQSDKGGPES
jgi:hypothetical protein